MKKAALLALSTIPGILVGYAVLTGILMKRVKPVPIVKLPEERRSRRAPRQPVSV